MNVGSGCELLCEHKGYCEFLSADQNTLKMLVQEGRMIQRCVCPVGYTGTGCELERTVCNVSTMLCPNGASCEKRGGGVYDCDCSVADVVSKKAAQMCRHTYTEYCSSEYDPIHPTSFCTNGGKCKSGLIAAKVAPGDTAKNKKFENAGCMCPIEYYGPHCEFLHHSTLATSNVVIQKHTLARPTSGSATNQPSMHKSTSMPTKSPAARSGGTRSGSGGGGGKGGGGGNGGSLGNSSDIGGSRGNSIGSSGSSGSSGTSGSGSSGSSGSSGNSSNNGNIQEMINSFGASTTNNSDSATSQQPSNSSKSSTLMKVLVSVLLAVGVVCSALGIFLYCHRKKHNIRLNQPQPNNRKSSRRMKQHPVLVNNKQAEVLKKNQGKKAGKEKKKKVDVLRFTEGTANLAPFVVDDNDEGDDYTWSSSVCPSGYDEVIDTGGWMESMPEDSHFAERVANDDAYVLDDDGDDFAPFRNKLPPDTVRTADDDIISLGSSDF